MIRSLHEMSKVRACFQRSGACEGREEKQAHVNTGTSKAHGQSKGNEEERQIMNTHIKTIGLLVLIVLSLPAWCIGDDRNGNNLLSECGAVLTSVDDAQSFDASQSKTFDVGFCLGLMQGMLHMNQFYEYQLKGAALFCQPDGTTTGQAARIVVKYLRDHPEELHIRDRLLAYMALRTAFPCANRKK